MRDFRQPATGVVGQCSRAAGEVADRGQLSAGVRECRVPIDVIGDLREQATGVRIGNRVAVAVFARGQQTGGGEMGFDAMLVGQRVRVIDVFTARASGGALSIDESSEGKIRDISVTRMRPPPRELNASPGAFRDDTLGALRADLELVTSLTTMEFRPFAARLRSLLDASTSRGQCISLLSLGRVTLSSSGWRGVGGLRLNTQIGDLRSSLLGTSSRRTQRF